MQDLAREHLISFKLKEVIWDLLELHLSSLAWTYHFFHFTHTPISSTLTLITNVSLSLSLSLPPSLPPSFLYKRRFSRLSYQPISPLLISLAENFIHTCSRSSITPPRHFMHILYIYIYIYIRACSHMH
jgi:hypothetical protein